MLLMLGKHLGFSYFPTAVTQLYSTFSINIFMVFLLMRFPLLYVDVRNFSLVVDWQQIIFLLLKWIDAIEVLC